MEKVTLSVIYQVKHFKQTPEEKLLYNFSIFHQFDKYMLAIVGKKNRK